MKCSCGKECVEINDETGTYYYCEDCGKIWENLNEIQ